MASAPSDHTVSIVPYEHQRNVVWQLQDEEYDFLWHSLEGKVEAGADPLAVANDVMTANGIWADRIQIVEQSAYITYNNPSDHEGPGSLSRMTYVLAQVFTHHTVEGDNKVHAGNLQAMPLAHFLEHDGLYNPASNILRELSQQ